MRIAVITASAIENSSTSVTSARPASNEATGAASVNGAQRTAAGSTVEIRHFHLFAGLGGGALNAVVVAQEKLAARVGAAEPHRLAMRLPTRDGLQAAGHVDLPHLMSACLEGIQHSLGAVEVLGRLFAVRIKRAIEPIDLLAGRSIKRPGTTEYSFVL